jgi:hypothetical protein
LTKEPSATTKSTTHDPTTTTTTSITAPYQPPVIAWDTIQLHVSLDQPEQPTDFVVILVHPRLQKRKRVKKHLRETLQSLLKIHGYRRVSENPDEEAETDQVDPLFPPPRPICLCILLNFRDLTEEQQQHNKESSTSSMIDTSDITETTMQVLQDYPVEPEQLVLLCGHVSLLNCYGLQLLHSFIYQAYLQRKRRDAETLLREIQNARRMVQPHVEMEYEDYVKVILKRQEKAPKGKRSPPANTVSNNKAAANDSTTQAPLSSNRRQVLSKTLPSSSPPQTTTQSVAVVPPPESPLNNNKHSNNTVDAARSALEAFLADSDSEEEIDDRQVVANAERNPRQINNPKNGASNKDSDTDLDTDTDEDDIVIYDGTNNGSTAAASRDETTTTPQTNDNNALVSTDNAHNEKTDSNNDSDASVESKGETAEPFEKSTAIVDEPHIAIVDQVSDDIHKRNQNSVSASLPKSQDTSTRQTEDPAPSSKQATDNNDDDSDESSDGSQNKKAAESVLGDMKKPQQHDSDDESDDDDFVIETTTPSRIVSTHSVNKSMETEAKPVTSPSSSFTASAEIKAALAAAQRQAEEMLLASTTAATNASPSSPTAERANSKPSKKKKKKSSQQ